MAAPSLCGAVLLLLGTAVNALAAPGPAAETKPHIPFNAMHPIPTPAPVLSDAIRHQLGRRATDSTPVLIAPDNTCGYVSGLSIASFTCVNPSATCVLVSSTSGINGIVGCCGSVDCGFRTTCVDSSQIASGSCGSSCSSNTNIVKCSESTLGFCNSISFSGGAVDYFCGDTTVAGFLQAETTFSGQTGRSYITFDLASLTSTETSGSAFGSSSSGGPAVSNIESIFTTQSPTSTTTSSSNDKSTNVGAIVGGVVGGLAVIALVVFGIWLLLRKKKRPAATATAATGLPGHAYPPQQPPQQQMYQNPPPAQFGQPGPQPMYYNPNNPNQAGYNPQQDYQQQGPQYNSYQNTPPPGGMAAAAGVGAAAGGYYGGKEAANLTPEPNRADSTSPVSNFNRFSTQPVSPGSTMGRSSFLPMQGVPPQGGQMAPVEAGGNVIGQNDPNSHHKGQLHELA